MDEEIKETIISSIEVKKSTLFLIKEIRLVAEKINFCYNNGNKILVCGNGGSAAQAQHMSGEIVCTFNQERRGLPCISLTTDTSILTAWSNDYNYNKVFERQVEAHGNEGDILFAITTSGNSINLIKAVEQAKKQGLITIGLLGKDGGRLKQLCNHNIIINSNDTPRIQETHIMIIHILCDILEKSVIKQKLLI